MIEDEEESITDANNFTDDAFSHASSSRREILDVKLDELVEAINNLTINNARY